MKANGKILTGSFFAAIITGAGLVGNAKLEDMANEHVSMARERVIEDSFKPMLRQSLEDAAIRYIVETQEAQEAKAREIASMTPEAYAGHKTMCDNLPGALEGALKAAWNISESTDLGVETTIFVDEKSKQTACLLSKNGEKLMAFSVKEYLDKPRFEDRNIDAITDSFMDKVWPGETNDNAYAKLRELVTSATYQTYIRAITPQQTSQGPLP